MNRSTRRATRRRLLASLRREGCRCAPRVIPDGTAAPGTRESGFVAHEANCPLWARIAAGGLGAMPTLVVDAARECDR
jgi:hypothetical protein